MDEVYIQEFSPFLLVEGRIFKPHEITQCFIGFNVVNAALDAASLFEERRNSNA